MQRATALHPRVVFSGIQPTGVPHLGNYVGALRQWVQLQHQEEPGTKLIYSVVDLHAITTPQDPGKLRRQKREALAALLAIGIDPDRSTLFYQSSVPAHSELMWILSCLASVGYLSRMTQWKQKLGLPSSSLLNDRPVGAQLRLGLFSYPVLQAADILVHRATHVPVGHDQQQHLEFARECATNFNHAYGPHLVHPETMTDPASKMSKSHKTERSRILITDTPEQIQSKVASALTDSIPGISYDTGRSPGQLAADCERMTPRAFKELVSDAIIVGLHGIRTRYLDLLDARGEYLDLVEAEGARKARKNAEETMHHVKTAVGLSFPPSL